MTKQAPAKPVPERKFVSIAIEPGADGGVWVVDSDGYIWMRPWGCREWAYRSVE